MRRMPAAPARVIAHPFFRDVPEGPIGSFNTQVGVLAELVYGDWGVEHAKLVSQARVVNLQDKSRFDHGLVLALEHRRHGIDVCLFGRVMGVEQEMAEPAWP